jgi:cation:H+ antiporter
MHLVGMLLVIVAAAALFTNALEHLGERLGISEGVTGSLFAAVGTALPETVIPLLALVSGARDAPGQAQVNEEISAGAILGAPLMLTTLSIFLVACSALPRRGWRGSIEPERSGLRRDLDFFLLAFAIAALALFVPAPARALRVLLAAALVLVYAAYLALTLRASRRLIDAGHGTRAGAGLWIARVGFAPRLPATLLQLGAGLALLLLGAAGFIADVAAVARGLGVSTLLLSLLVVPVATELPEKLNSMLWLRSGKDTLALGNITGALVFQGTLLPALGILATPWQARTEVTAGALLTLLGAGWLRTVARGSGLRLLALLPNGALYLAYLAVALAAAR